jgi:Tol biopolymer transport system component
VRLMLVSLLGAVLILSFAAPSAHGALPGMNGKIAFITDRHPTHSTLDLYTVNPDGTDVTPVVDHLSASEVRQPAWSWDGARLAFATIGSNYDIYTSFADGSMQTNITADRFGNLEHPTWSPDDTRIAFSSSNENAIFIRNVDGTGEQTVVLGEDPSWSPDGSQIAFERLLDGDIWTVNKDGSGLNQLTSGPDRDRNPDWSPDGSKIAFERQADGETGEEVYVMDSDGSNQVRLTNTDTPGGFSREPAWSPDGSRIAFVSNVDGDYEIYTMDAGDGTDVAQVTSDPARDFEPAWQPVPAAVSGAYARPKFASPIGVSLVTAFQQCQGPEGDPPPRTPNRTHGPPLEYPSCNPPVRENGQLTVGTPDWNGYAANSVGSVRIAAPIAVPGPPDDADVKVDVSITDVHCSSASNPACPASGTGAAPDYVGELLATARVRITDRDNQTPYPGPPWPGTGVDIVVSAKIPCAATPEGLIGSTCTTATTLDAVVPGMVKEAQRSVWAFDRVEVHGGGEDGNVDTPADNTRFLTQGVFVP